MQTRGKQQHCYVLSCGTGRTFEFVPALKYLGPDFKTEHVERESSKYAYQFKYVHGILKKITEYKKRFPTSECRLILLDVSLASLLLCIRYRFSNIAVILRIRCDYFKELASHLSALRVKGVITSLFQLVMIALANKIIGISSFQIKRLPARKKKICYVPIIRKLPENRGSFIEMNAKNRAILFITVSNFEHWPKTKGTIKIIGLFSKAAKGKNCVLDVYGAGRYASKVAYVAKQQLPLIRFQGFTNDIDKVYQNADAFIYGSYLESFGASLLEARLHGLPCAILDYPSLREQVQDPRQVIPRGEPGRKKLEAFIDFAASDEAKRLAIEDMEKAAVHHSPENAGRYLRSYLGESIK